MKQLITLLLFMLALQPLAYSQDRLSEIRENIPLDSIRLSDPCILADPETSMYYMTGTGALLWKSRDLKFWTGPFRVVETDPDSWMGPRPMIWAAELHQYKDKYYNFATFTNREVKIDMVKGNVIERRASHILVSDKAEGPYRSMEDPTYLPADKPTLDGTFWVDEDGKPYMVYCYEWLQNWDGTIERIELKPDLSGSVGESKLLFKASESPWSRERNENGDTIPNKVTDGPWLFRTQTGKLGMLWTSWVFGDYTQGVAYSESGTLDGPWIHDEKPFTPPNYGHGMLFRTFEGQLLMAVHSHWVGENGRYIRIPKLFEVDDSGDKLVLGQPFSGNEY
ncbi:glycoside hydrolase family 43 protein [Cyclobacterium plantarum]|uniref:Family 43 glycosylhydrolase n=1 Tax=Cyclobacterium plantarum TaxID=2716263 RepID=A0ABX0H7L4_9BACT|nr:glycoside hydrolase family 43 protein [Cyclobacterium plantarum]NHE57846.1 family 43 glycosylhydrolase [Cyclobacterium plantarum]